MSNTALGFPFGFFTNDNLPQDAKYYNRNTKLPYANVTEATNSVLMPTGIRYKGLTVNIAGKEYWWKDGIEDGDLVPKISEGIPTKTSDLTNDGEDGTNPYITALDIPTFASADKMVTIGRNATGSTLYKGTVVYISGSTGNRPNFVKARADVESTSAGTFGVVLSDINNNSDGNVVTIGAIDTLDTRSSATHPFTTDTLVDGDTVYLSPTTAGYITNVKPSAPNHLVYVGKVVRTSPTQGTIVYRIQNGYELDEIHDVAITEPQTGDVPSFNQGNSLWENKSIPTILGYTPKRQGYRIFNNADIALDSTDAYIAQIGTMSTIRYATLPAANSVAQGYEIIVVDESGSVSITNSINVKVQTATGSDTIDGATNVSISAPYGMRRFFSDGVSKWTYDGGIARLSGATFIGNITAPNLSSTNTGDETDLKFRRQGYTKFLDFYSNANIGEFIASTYGSASHNSPSGFGGAFLPTGMTRFRSSTTNPCGFNMSLVNTALQGYFLLPGMGLDYIFLLPATTTNNTVRVGHNAFLNTSADYTDGVYFEIVGNTLWGKTAKTVSGTTTRSLTGTFYTLVSNTLYHIRLRVISSVLVQYFLFDESGSQLWADSLTLNIPIGTGIFVAAQLSANSTAGIVQDIISNDFLSYTIPGQNRGALT